MPTLVSIQVGKPTERSLKTNTMQDSRSRQWTSGIFKTAVSGHVWLGKLNLSGDGQADLVNHGGPDRAVLMYAAEHYDYWRKELPEVAWEYGGFGENFTISGLNEETVCLGDVYEIGAVRIQISQPRQPCWKLARRWRIRDLAIRVTENQYSGWYARTLVEGEVEAGLPVTLVERPYPDWAINRVRYVADHYDENPQLAQALAQIPALSEGWREGLAAATEAQS
jgi:MOSC domain-containing protein YiiM